MKDIAKDTVEEVDMQGSAWEMACEFLYLLFHATPRILYVLVTETLYSVLKKTTEPSLQPLSGFFFMTES